MKYNVQDDLEKILNRSKLFQDLNNKYKTST